MALADLGARVIKVEEPEHGDETRAWGPPFESGVATYFLSINRNKESVALDLKSEQGREAVRAIAAKADVVMENFRPGVAERLGMGFDDLARINPRLIYASISGFGQEGPDRGKPGYDLILQAITGLMKVSAAPGGPPVKCGFPVADMMAASFASQAILAALYRRTRTGEGARIEISLIESLLAAMPAITASYLIAGKEPAPMGVGQSNIAPYQSFQCQDDQIVIAVTNERIWQRFCDALARPEWLIDGRFQGNAERTRNRTALAEEIHAVLATASAVHWIDKLKAASVPCGGVQTVGQILDQRDAAAVDVEGLKMVGNPMHISGIDTEYRRPPRLGEHTRAVLDEFGVG
jgi:crotonobetainyl-CoA:carnitine CoA-transferase CaiB-like acyl-CoA transferase